MRYNTVKQKRLVKKEGFRKWSNQKFLNSDP